MELSARYAYKVNELKSFSAAAKELFISQPALSASISRLEKELGFKIFDRATVPLTLTQEGRIYMESLDEIVESERTMAERIKRISDMNYGKVAIGGASQASYYVLACVCREYKKRFPKIEISLDIGNVGTSTNLSEKIKSHALDLIISYDHSSSIYERTKLFDEQLVVAVRRDMPAVEPYLKYSVSYDELISGDIPEEKKLDDLSMLASLPYLTYPKDANVTKHMRELIGDFCESDCKINNARHGGVHYQFMREGLGALMTTTLIARTNPLGNNNIVFFVPRGERGLRAIYIAKPSDLPATVAAKKFIQLAKEMCDSGEIFRSLAEDNSQ